MTVTLTVVPDDAAAKAEDLLTSMEAIRQAGISYRQLDFWHRAGYLKAEQEWNGSGSLRLWSEAEVRVARAMGRLVDAGLTVRMAAIVARNGWTRSQIGPGVWLELGPALSEHCERDSCETCWPVEPSDCGHGCHDDEGRSS